MSSSHGGPVLPWETLIETHGTDIMHIVGPDRADADAIEAGIEAGEIELTEANQVRLLSRQSNLNKSVNAATVENRASEASAELENAENGPNSPNSGGDFVSCENGHENKGETSDTSTPTVPPHDDVSKRIEEKVSEFKTAYPRRATFEVAGRAGVSIRRDYANVETEEWTENQPDIPELEATNAVKGESVESVTGIEWGEAVRTLLEKYERTKNTTINLEKGDWRDPAGHMEFSISAENRWFASYQKKYYAQLSAWLRELCGGERPSGGETEATFENPRVALITRSASSTPGSGEVGVRSECKSCGETYGFQVSEVGDCVDCGATASVLEVENPRVGPVDHAHALRDSWEPVYHTLRNTLRSEGYELGESWQYDRRLEPHTGKRGSMGVNEGYAHEHVIVVVDGDVSAGDLQPVIDKHVSECEWAGADAHGKEAIEVREPDELNDVAAYVADYCSIDPVELWEREPAYVGWAAAMDAGNVRTVSRSEAAREAAVADACRQRAESAEADQEAAHGEEVRREIGTGRVVCAECDAAHDIHQEQTLTAARSVGSSVVADGGRDVIDDAAREEELRERWPSADAAAVVGESIGRRKHRKQIERELERTPDVPAVELVGRLSLPPERVALVREVRAGVDRESAVGFDESVPEWHVKSVTVDGEEHAASAGNGIEMVEVTDIRERVAEMLDAATKYECMCGTSVWGDEMAGHIGGHGLEAGDVMVTDGGRVRMDYPERYGPAGPSGPPSVGEDNESAWACRSGHGEVWVPIGGECPRCGRPEPEESDRV